MADSDLDRGGDTEVSEDRQSAAGMPRWVKVFVVIGLALVALFVIASVTGVGGEHGPGRHGGDNGGHQSPIDH